MSIETKATLKGYFETNDTPTEAQFASLIDTLAVDRKITDDKTADYNVATTDLSKVLTMNHADAKTFSLPSVGSGDVGIGFTFVKLGAGKVTIDAADSDKIADSGAGDTIYNDQAAELFATITLQLVSETQWAIVGAMGTWITTD